MTGDRDAPGPHVTEPGGPDLHRLAAVEAELGDVEHALARLDAGTWGTCETCADSIDQVTLAQRPAARTCAAHD